jgi:hypothetical protein
MKVALGAFADRPESGLDRTTGPIGGCYWDNCRGSGRHRPIDRAEHESDLCARVPGLKVVDRQGPSQGNRRLRHGYLLEPRRRRRKEGFPTNRLDEFR